MIHSAEEFITLRRENDERATTDTAPEPVWWDLIDNHPEMKEWVIHNKNVPKLILEVLADDPDPHVRWAVATKRKCPPAVLEKLARDADVTVRVRVAYNPKTPESVLTILRVDDDPLVAQALDARGKRATGEPTR